MAERHPFYTKAKHTLECAERSDAELIEHILELIKENE
jgi:hypothetical protein